MKFVFCLLAFTSFNAFALTDMCGKVTELTIDGPDNFLYEKFDSVSGALVNKDNKLKSFRIVSSGAGAVLTIAKLNDVEVCVDDFSDTVTILD